MKFDSFLGLLCLVLLSQLYCILFLLIKLRNVKSLLSRIGEQNASQPLNLGPTPRELDPTEAELKVRIRHQSAVAQLSQRGLAGTHLSTLMNEAANIAAQTLEVEYCQIWELLPNGSTALLRAGVGGNQELVGVATTRADPESQMGYTLRSSNPAIVEDLRLEDRFNVPPLLHDHQAIAGVCLKIPSPDGLFGILGVYSTKERTFREWDIDFLQGIAHVLTAAIARQQAEDRLNLMQRAMDATNSGVVICDATAADTPIVYVNSRFEQLTGYRREDVLGLNCRFLQGTDVNQLAIAQLRQAIAEGRECHATLRNYRKDGRLFWNELHVAPVCNEEGHLTHFIGVQNDISDRIQAEDALRSSQTRFSGILDIANDAIISVDEHLCIQLFNQGAEQIFGYTAEEILGQSLDRLLPQRYHTAHCQYIKRFSQSTDVARKMGNRPEVFARRKDGTEFPAEASISKLQLQEGKIFTVILRDITERKHTEEALRESETRLSTIVAATTDALIVIDTLGVIQFANPAAAQLFGRPMEALHGFWIGSPSVVGEIAEIQIIQSNGNPIIAEMHIAETMWNKEKVYLASLRDITERKQTEVKLRESEEKYRRIVETAAEGIWMLDGKHKTTFVNRQMAEMLGYTVEEMLGKSPFDFADEGDWEKLHEKLLRRQQGVEEKYDFKLRAKDGSECWVLVSAQPLFNGEGNYIGVLKMLIDINDRKRAEAQLQHNAFYDSLTNLPNRTLFIQKLAEALYQSQESAGASFAVLFLDLDNFKAINDSLGHTVGDRLLVAIARCLETCLRENDTFARWGGDEFTLLLTPIDSLEEVIPIAQKIHDFFQSPFNLEGYEVFSSVSIGIALGSQDYRSPEELLRDADVAMYHAKARGKSHYAVFDRKMHKKALARLQMETDLRKALERQEFLVYYQPIVALSSGQIAGFEALVRWQHPEKGLISPARFIPVAEETGAIVPLGLWVLQEACRQLSLWQQQFPQLSPLKMSVNLSGKQLQELDLVARIQQILVGENLDGSHLKLEVTESWLMDNTETAAKILKQLRAMNIQVAIDDFGTGYSSLSYLHRFPVTTLKIDRSFVMRMSAKNDNIEIIKAILSLTRALQMEAIAEGIETPQQLAQLQGLSCEYGQGYLFAQPLEAQAAQHLLAQPIVTD